MDDLQHRRLKFQKISKLIMKTDLAVAAGEIVALLINQRKITYSGADS